MLQSQLVLRKLTRGAERAAALDAALAELRLLVAEALAYGEGEARPAGVPSLGDGAGSAEARGIGFRLTGGPGGPDGTDDRGDGKTVLVRDAVAEP